MQASRTSAPAASRIAQWRSAVGWPLLLLAICAGFFWKLTLTTEYTWLDSPDYAYQVLPWFQYQAGEWHAGRFPLWDPYLWGGQPLLAQMQPGAVYPLNWLLFLTPLRDGWLRQGYLHWYFVLIHFQAALFCYWLCRDLGRTRAASLVAGAAFGLGGFMGTNGWPQMLNGAVWAPLVLMFFLRAMRGHKPVASAAWSGAFLGIAFLSGHHQVPVYITLAMGGAWIYYLYLDWRRWKLAAVFGIFLASLAAVQILPAYEYGKLSLRWVGAQNPVTWADKTPYYIHGHYSLFPESIFGIVIPGIFRNSDPFMGLVAVTMALIGLATNWSDRIARLVGGMAIGGLLFSLAPNTVFHGVLYSLVPLVEKSRSPSMAILIFNFGLAVLIAYGIDGYHRFRSRWTIWAVCGLASLVGILTLALLVVKKPADERMAMVTLAGLALAAILSAWREGRISERAAVSCLFLLMLVELSNVTTWGYRSRAEVKLFTSNLSEHADIARFLQAQDGPVRAEINAEDVPYNFGDWYGIDHYGGYLASLTQNVMRVMANRTAHKIYGINYRIAKEPDRADQVEVFTGSSGVKVFRNPAAYAERAWVVHEARSIEFDDQVGPSLEDPNFDPRRQTFVKGEAPRLEPCEDEKPVKVLSRTSGHIVLEAELQCRGMVIYADTYYPGWTATVDNQPARVYEAYGFVRGVVADAGPHRIELRFRPRSVYWGAALTLSGLFAAVLLSVRQNRETRPG